MSVSTSNALQALINKRHRWKTFWKRRKKCFNYL